MPRLSKSKKQEWDFFINPETKRRTYNSFCRRCIHTYKQSYRAEVIECHRYRSKRAEKYALKSAPKADKKCISDQLRKRYTSP